MGYRIEGIEIESFRGIRRLSLPLEGRNLIVVGENGSGKSSIVDAIEYFFTGGIQHLEGRADVKKKMSVPNLMGGVPRVTMRLGDGSSTKEVSRVYGRRDEGIPAAMRPFFERAARRPLVLRRHQILAFINARDSGRYEQISELVGLGDLDEAERRWGVVLGGLAILGSLHRPGCRLGTALAHSGYAEARFVKLLRARGSQLLTEVLSAFRFLAAKASPVDATDLARLVLVTSPEKEESIRRQIARDYYAEA